MAGSQNLLKKNSIEDEASTLYMFRLAWPMVVSTISFTIMQFVDTRMVAELGTDELAAILPATFLSFIPASLALGVITVLNTFVSQNLGAGKYRQCSSYCWQTIYMGLAYSLIILCIFWPLAPKFFAIMNQPHEIIPMEVTYLRIILYSQFMLIFIWCCNQFFIGIHRPRITMYITLIGQVVNILANYILIFGKFGFAPMGIAGAGWGTFIGTTVGASIRLIWFLNTKIGKTFHTRNTMRVDFAKMHDLLKIGFPAGFGFMINIAFWALILFGLVGKFGKEHLAATSAVWSCMRFSFMPIIGVGAALTAAVGKSIGEKRKDLAVAQTHICLRIALLYMSFMGLCFFLFRRPIMNFWAPDDPEVIAIGINILICAAIFQVFDAVLIIYNDALRGAGDTLYLAIIESIGAVFILGFGGFFMVKLFPDFGAVGPWMAAIGKIIFGAAANWMRFKSNHWMKIDLLKKKPIESVEIERASE